jgi:hypothetical protein
MGFLFDRRDKKNIVAIGYNEHNLTWVSPLVRVNQNVLQAVFLNRSNDFFKGYAAPNLQSFILIRIPPEWLHKGIISAGVPFVIIPIFKPFVLGHACFVPEPGQNKHLPLQNTREKLGWKSLGD